jgi:hypothetical protein
MGERSRADAAARVAATLLRLPLMACLAGPLLIVVAVVRAPWAGLALLATGTLLGLGVGALAGASGWRGLGLWATGGAGAGAVVFLGGFVVVQARSGG